MTYFPDDIDRKIKVDFSPGETVEVHAAFESLAGSNPAIGARVLRCILHLAQGDYRRVMDLVENAKLDYRDVILWAEYDEKGKQKLRDFNKPF